MSLHDDIANLKRKHNALILAHFYEDDEVQDAADHVGDSLFLAQMGQKSTAPVVLFAGVSFMAESVKILSPDKTVLLPDVNAGCSLVDHSPFDKYLSWRQQNPEAIAVTYINSSAMVKSISDVICTSTNAEKIIRSIPEDRRILFGPDQHLGRYLSQKLQRKLELWPGSCEVHVLFSARKLHTLKRDNPEALVLAHPECMDAVLAEADVVGSTSRLLGEVESNHSVNTFIVATEAGIFHQMQKVRPDATLIQAPAEGSCACNICPYMKLNTLEKIKLSLEALEPEVRLERKLLDRARLPLERMMHLSNDKSVNWPEGFEHEH